MKCFSCSVFGHREIVITRELEDLLLKTFENLIQQGCQIFYFGGFGMFDELCHKVVSELKKTYKYIRRIFCLSDPGHLRISKRPIWISEEDYEEFIYLDLKFDWWYQRIYYRNCSIIDNSDVVVFYVEERESSGAYKALKYALKRKKKIINLMEK